MSALQEHILILIQQIMKVLTEKLVQVSKVGHCKKWYPSPSYRMVVGYITNYVISAYQH